MPRPSCWAALVQDDGAVIYNEFTQKTNWPFGGAIAFILMAVTLT
jgi:ABC-type spermidine/putrescine transport system permease subunit I